MARTEALLARHAPDVLCLQETKLADDQWPAERFEELGYHSAGFGQRTYNGVAILARGPLEDVRGGFPSDPVPTECRVVSALASGIRVIDVYAINGKAVHTPSYELKLAWFDALRAWISEAFDPEEPLVVVGDMNVAPADPDVHDPELWRGKNLASEPERERIRSLEGWGLVDLLRVVHADGPGPFTWWDYRMGAFHRGWGLRLDLALGTRPIAARVRDVRVDREERKPSTGEGKPSDHAPLIVDLD